MKPWPEIFEHKIIDLDKSKIEYQLPTPNSLELILSSPKALINDKFEIILKTKTEGEASFIFSYTVSSYFDKEQAKQEYDRCFKILKSGNYKIKFFINNNRAEIMQTH